MDSTANNNLDIFICSHKEFKPMVKNKCYKVLFTKKGITAQDTELEQFNADNGDKLPLDDKFYSEIYAYKYVKDNIPLKKYVGFCHYRKYFGFMDEIPDIDDLFKKCDCICNTPIRLFFTNKTQYEKCHNIDDLNIVGKIIHEKFTDYENEFKKFIGYNYMFGCNMFIMKSEDFKEYCDFIQGVLDEYLKIVGTDIYKRIEENKDKYIKRFSPNNTAEYQYRIGGYLAERLTNVFILKKFKKVAMFNMKTTEKKYKHEV